MIFLYFLFTFVKNDCTSYYGLTSNESISCTVGCITISNSLFSKINQQTLIENCNLTSISIFDCSFIEVSSIIDSDFSDLQTFSFERNCCNNNLTNSDMMYMDVLAQSECKLSLNTFANFRGTNSMNFINLNSPSTSVTNLNLTNNNRYNKGISITQPSNILRFNDETFYNVDFTCHIHINGPADSYSIDRINDNGRSTNSFLQLENDARYIISRIYLSNYMEISAGNGYIWLVESYIPHFFPTVGRGTPGIGAIVVDSMNTMTSTYFINHLSVPECQTNEIKLVYPPTGTYSKSTKLSIAFSIIGGLLLGVIVFLAIFFGVKYLIKYYEKKQDEKNGDIFQ